MAGIKKLILVQNSVVVGVGCGENLGVCFKFEISSIEPRERKHSVYALGGVCLSEGYFRSLDRDTGTITISPHMNAAEIRKGIGVKTLSSFNKFTVDRLGRKFKIRRELRTWRGKACT